MVKQISGRFEDERQNLIEFDIHYDFQNQSVIAYKKLVRNNTTRIQLNQTIASRLIKHVRKNLDLYT